MAEKPILFSGPMVKAILEGRKSMTRRVLKPQPLADGYYEGPLYCDKREAVAQFPACFLFSAKAVGGGAVRAEVYEPAYDTGDLLWVREACANVPGRERMVYLADMLEVPRQRDPAVRAMFASRCLIPRAALKGRPSIHMPSWASRITLRVTAVKVERLQDISRGDAMAEGCPFPNMAAGPNPRDWFRDLWNEIHGPGSWDANPWVAAYSFERIAS